MSRRDTLRTEALRPYRPGLGPWFLLETWDTGRTDEYGKSVLGYTLTQRTISAALAYTDLVLFEGEDFSCSPLDAIDSDACLAALLGFLTLRPGDTDPEYFDDYTDAQRAYCDAHAESLQGEAIARFGED